MGRPFPTENDTDIGKNRNDRIVLLQTTCPLKHSAAPKNVQYAEKFVTILRTFFPATENDTSRHVTPRRPARQGRV